MGARNVLRLFNNAVAGGVPITSTTDGLTTGIIPTGYGFVVVTSSSANNRIALPSNIIGMVIRVLVGTNGVELVAVDAAATVNNVTVGATNELAIPADTMLECICVSATAWIVLGFDTTGDDLQLIPDAR